VIALDARTGRTLWEHRYRARTGFEDFSFGPGPHATPLVVGDRLFTVGTGQQLFAFDKRTGRVLWSRDFVRDFQAPELLLRPVVKVGYGCSPLAFADTILCSVGGPGQSVMAFRQSDGAVVWKSGDFLPAAAAPILISLGGRPQVVFLAGGSIVGLDPATGRILWAHPHDPGNDLNCGTPIFGPDNILFVSSAYQAGSRAIRLVPRGDATDVEELWFTNRVRFMFLSAVRVGDFVYGTTGDFGPAFLTALDLRTGESAWQARGFPRASLIHADGKAIVLTEDGDLALVRISPAGADVLARAKVFDTMSWTAPTLVGTTLYARDREKIVALDLSAPGVTPAGPRVAPALQPPPEARGQAAAGPPRPAAAPPPVPPARLAGSWELDPAGTTMTAGAFFAGLTTAGAPRWLFVTEAQNGAVLVESPLNTGHTRHYQPGRSTTTAIANGTITMAATLAGGRLVADGRIAASSGAVTSVKETLRRDGDVLEVEIDHGGERSTARYVRLGHVGPCTGWPTPCKKAAR
jgi:outer membrane protein assembly factor BamB